MTTPHDDEQSWEYRLSAQIAETITHYRDKRGVSTQWIADRATELGFPMKRGTLATFLTFRARKGISVQELSAIGRALDVPPIRLLFPVHSGERAEVLPETVVDAAVAAEWWSGAETGPVMEPGLNRPLPGDAKVPALYERYFHSVALFQSYNRIAATLAFEAARAVPAGSPDVPDGVDLSHLLQNARGVRGALGSMNAAREDIRREGLPVPALPPGLDESSVIAEPAWVPVVSAVEALPGGVVRYPLVAVDAAGGAAVQHGPA